MTLLNLIQILTPILVFFGSAFFWLLKRQDRKAAEDKLTFQDLYRQIVAIKEDVAFLKGKKAGSR